MPESDLTPLVKAGFTAVYVLTAEPEEVQKDVLTACSAGGWEAVVWDCDRGTLFPLEGRSLPVGPAGPSPLEPLRLAAPEDGRRRVVLLHNYHRFLDSAGVLQAFANAAAQGKSEGVTFVVCSPVLKIPAELGRTFRLVEHTLPGPDQLRLVHNRLLERPDDTEVAPEVLAAAKGLTVREAEDAFCLSITKYLAVLPEEVWSLKAQAVRKRGLLEITRGGPKFNSLGGLDALKTLGKGLLRHDAPEPCNGFLLVGPPGTGKSAWCKSLGAEVGQPTLALDFGRLYGSLVGQSEANLRDALCIAEAMSPCILFADEVEKALAGASGGEGDSGVSQRLFGHFLTWLNDREERGTKVTVVATANDVSRLPPEFARPGRFDVVAFIDLPGREEKDLMWQMYTEKYKVGTLPGLVGKSVPAPPDQDWTGAEIKACCRLARQTNTPLIEAHKYVIPVSATAGEKVTALRRWAANRCVDANKGGAYAGPDERKAGGARRVGQ